MMTSRTNKGDAGSGTFAQHGMDRQRRTVQDGDPLDDGKAETERPQRFYATELAPRPACLSLFSIRFLTTFCISEGTNLTITGPTGTGIGYPAEEMNRTSAFLPF